MNAQDQNLKGIVRCAPYATTCRAFVLGTRYYFSGKGAHEEILPWMPTYYNVIKVVDRFIQQDKPRRSYLYLGGRGEPV